VKTIDIISKGKSNFEDVLASQTCVFGKSSLGFNPQSKQSGFCRIRRFSVPKGILKWVPKDPNVHWKHINTYGPKFVMGPDLGT